MAIDYHTHTELVGRSQIVWEYHTKANLQTVEGAEKLEIAEAR